MGVRPSVSGLISVLKIFLTHDIFYFTHLNNINFYYQKVLMTVSYCKSSKFGHRNLLTHFHLVIFNTRKCFRSWVVCTSCTHAITRKDIGFSFLLLVILKYRVERNICHLTFLNAFAIM